MVLACQTIIASVPNWNSTPREPEFLESSVSRLPKPDDSLGQSRLCLFHNASNPTGLTRICYAYPGLPPWANFFRPHGAEQSWRKRDSSLKQRAMENRTSTPLRMTMQCVSFGLGQYRLNGSIDAVNDGRIHAPLIGRPFLLFYWNVA
jgi:hypothetical protein